MTDPDLYYCTTVLALALALTKLVQVWVMAALSSCTIVTSTWLLTGIV